MVLFLLGCCIGCSGQKTEEPDKATALKNYTTCKQLADEWFRKLDSTDFSSLLSVYRVRAVPDEEVLSYINEVRREFGKVKGRTPLGAHIYDGKNLLTYVPDVEDGFLAHINAARSEDGFYIVQPKYFGLTSYGAMFSGLPEGEYVMLMSKVLPSNKSYAEEEVIFWKNPDGAWQVVYYKIADEI